MSRPRDVQRAIAVAERILPGKPAPDGAYDIRWQALMKIEDFIEFEPDAIWPFVLKWGCYEDEDLRAAVATLLLEHLLEYHFDLIFPKVESAVRSNSLFAKTFKICWKLGEAKESERSERFDRLRASL
jgi:hypothetical protein